MTFLRHAEKQGNKFLNPEPTTIGGLSMIVKVLPLYLKNREETEPKTPLGPFVTDARLYDTPPPTGLRVTWFGHSSSLVEIDGFRILIDPVWDKRASPVEWMGPKRFFAPTLTLAALPKIDAVLISHDHYDHFGSKTIKQLAKLPALSAAQWITSLGVGKRMTQRGVPADRIVELDWTDSTTVGAAAGLTITALPARHFSGRGVRDRFTTLWSSFVLQTAQHRIYFGADSGWWDGFPEIASTYGPFDLTMLEIGAFHPLWHQIHLGPDSAARAFAAMGGPASAGLLMPIHWGLFNLALHGWRQPISRLNELAEANGFSLWSPTPGEPTTFDGEPFVSTWWRPR